MQEVTELFSYFDKDGSGQISFDEFLVALRVCSMFYSDLYSSPSLLDNNNNNNNNINN